MSRLLSLCAVLLCGLVSVTMAAPTCAPTTTTHTTIPLAWDAPTPMNVSGYTLHQYQLQQQQDTGAWVDLTPPSATVTRATVSGLQSGHTYTYRLAAVYHTPDGSLATSVWSTYGVPNPCVAITVLEPPGNLRLDSLD